MQIQMTGHHVEITAALREFTEKKLQKLSHHIDKITSIHITFDVDKLEQIAEGQVAVPGNVFHAKANAENMYTAVESMVEKLLRQLIKHKEKQTGHH